MAKRQVENFTVEAAVSAAFGELESLAEEMRSWYDNMPESFQNAERGERVGEAADTLEQIQAPELPKLLEERDIVEVSMYPVRKRASRADRRDWAVGLLDQAASMIRTLAEELEKEEGTEDDTLEGIADEIESAKDEAEQVEFPSMYG